LVDPLIEGRLIPDVFQDSLFIQTSCGRMVTPGPKTLAFEIAPLTHIRSSYMNGAFTLDVPDNLGN
jgi:hypothetical protein|tara:strand:- start:815 stop:1012 length:198 start_codon:yes stop_codon:yes gene_type:complete